MIWKTSYSGWRLYCGAEKSSDGFRHPFFIAFFHSALTLSLLFSLSLAVEWLTYWKTSLKKMLNCPLWISESVCHVSLMVGTHILCYLKVNPSMHSTSIQKRWLTVWAKTFAPSWKSWTKTQDINLSLTKHLSSFRDLNVVYSIIVPCNFWFPLIYGVTFIKQILHGICTESMTYACIFLLLILLLNYNVIEIGFSEQSAAYLFFLFSITTWWMWAVFYFFQTHYNEAPPNFPYFPLPFVKITKNNRHVYKV